MKKVFLLGVMLFTIAHSYAQSKQIRVLLQQIAALKVYGDYVHKGYSIAKKGLKTISDLKDGELGLHTIFYTALKTVNPNISNSYKVATILELQLKIMKENSAVSGLLYDDLFHGTETDYIERVFGRLMKDCDAHLDALLDILSDNSLEMDDAARIEGIDGLYEQMLDNYTFSKNFSAEVTQLLKVRQRDKKDITTGRILTGTTPQP